LNLVEKLISKKWCEHFSSFLSAASDHDTREKILNSLFTLRNDCLNELDQNQSVLETLQNLKNEYENLVQSESTEDSQDGYFKNILNTLEEILFFLRSVKKEL
jgi:nucleotide exchange factor SIL1